MLFGCVQSALIFRRFLIVVWDTRHLLAHALYPISSTSHSSCSSVGKRAARSLHVSPRCRCVRNFLFTLLLGNLSDVKYWRVNFRLLSARARVLTNDPLVPRPRDGCNRDGKHK